MESLCTQRPSRGRKVCIAVYHVDWQFECGKHPTNQTRVCLHTENSIKCINTWQPE